MQKFGAFTLGVLIPGIFFLSVETGWTQKKSTPPIPKYYGFCYGPFRQDENPERGKFPSISEMKEDLSFVSKFTKRIRTYGNGSTLNEIPTICEMVGLECYAGAWISNDTLNNSREIGELIRISGLKLKTLKGVVIGNEVLLRHDLTVSQLSALIKLVKDAVDIPVGTADTWDSFEQFPEIAEQLDFILVHIHPYWDHQSVDDAVNDVIAKYQNLKNAFPGKTVIIGETGWPAKGETLGNAVPSLKNQQQFFTGFTKTANEKHIPYFYFEIFDESWKTANEGDAGGSWGIFQEDGAIKSMCAPYFPVETANGFNRRENSKDKIKQ